MKFLVLLLFPVLSFSQSKLDTVSLLSGKVKMLAPKDLSEMSEQTWVIKYHTNVKPMLVLSDENAEVNLIADMTQQALEESQLTQYKDFRIEQLKKSHPELTMIDNGIKTINGKKVGYVKFITQATDQKIFNYYFFTLVSGKVLFFTFNCIQSLRNTWEITADKMVASITIK